MTVAQLSGVDDEVTMEGPVHIGQPGQLEI